MLPAPYRIQLRRPPIRCAEMHPSADLEAHTVHTASQPHSQPDRLHACTPARLLQHPVAPARQTPPLVHRGPCSRGVKLFSAAPQTINVTQSLSRALSHLRLDKLTPSLFAQRAPRSLPRILPPPSSPPLLPPTSNQLARPGQIVRRSNHASSTHQ
jgi:hypothetical protein